MGKIVMPKNSALLDEIEAVLKIYYEADGWLSNDDYKTRLKSIIGDDQYSSSYTKKAQITSYFGFTEWQDINNARSLRRITSRGKLMYEALCKKDDDVIQELLMKSLETVTFGRNNYGCPDSNSDVEPPVVFIRAILDMGYFTYKEFAYTLWRLEDCGGNYTDVLNEIKEFRSQGILDLNEEATKYTDCKPIMILHRWGFLDEDTSDGPKGTGGTRIIIRQKVKDKYLNRLRALKIYNIDMFSAEPIENEEIMKEEMKMPTCLDKERKPRTMKEHPLNSIIYGAPGTGKTYSTAEYAQAIIEGISLETFRANNPDRKEVMKKYNDLIRAGQIIFTTFHQSYGYEEFIQGLRPDTTSDKMNFKTVDGVFKRIADRALNDDENNYVIIIDEINRANISKVFGELITLIEDDKRWGELNQTSATLQSGDPFAVPNNLYIVGTMNSADKSISLIDAALRRRFEFIEQKPDASLVTDPDMRRILEKINALLAEQLDSADLLIGHSYFMNRSIDELPKVLNNSIIPLLYEYFYDNKKKVMGILNSAVEQVDYVIEDDKLGRIFVERQKNN